MHELSAGAIVDPRQARDVARWRRAERERLLGLRGAIPPAERLEQTQRLCASLSALIPPDDRILSLYWPIRGEPDLREWMRQRLSCNGRVALPVATELGRPLEFREWRNGARMTRGLWNIPYPADGAAVRPAVILAPLVGFDGGGFRLGYGGGFFDRTLASLDPRPTVVGVGYAVSEIATIYPQPHDIGMDWIVTGDGAPRRFSRA
ncbi:MAG: 5-formyltetrahydrofolate cyclo-ligase [Proteobacteria bacterium]|nr:5-formyltetrahydrofolate cyclo-ligase [Pseudomonadota bacterium]